MKTNDAIGKATQGVLSAQERVATSAQRVSRGDVSTEAIVQTKLDATNLKAQVKGLKSIMELEESVLNILA